jgi:serine/threonine-protein kinase
VILYQFLTGERPFSGSSTATMHKVLEEDPLPPSRFNVQVPAAMDAVVRKALAKRPEDRYQSADEFAAAIREALVIERPSGATATMTGAMDPTVMAPAVTAAELRAEATRTAASATASHSAASAAASTPPGAPPAAPAPAATAPSGTKSQTTTIAIVAGIAAIVIAAGVYLMVGRSGGDAAKVAGAPPPPPPTTAAPAMPPASPSAAAPSAPSTPSPPQAAAKAPVGSLVISAVGLVDPKNPRYGSDKSAMQADLRADSMSQAVEKSALPAARCRARSRRTISC